MNSLSPYTRELSWQLKKCLSYSPTLREKQGTKKANKTFKNFKSKEQRIKQLMSHYQLDDWPNLCNQTEYIENFYLLDLLDQHLKKITSNNGPGLEIGCRNFSYLPALSAFASQPWHGIELDAHARY